MADARARRPAVQRERAEPAAQSDSGAAAAAKPAAADTHAEEDGDRRARRKRQLLGLYYGVGAESEQKHTEIVNPVNIDGSHFDVHQYMRKLLAERSLGDLMDLSNRMSAGA